MCERQAIEASANRRRIIDLDSCDNTRDEPDLPLPNSLTFVFKVRVQVALFSPRRLPNPLTSARQPCAQPPALWRQSRRRCARASESARRRRLRVPLVDLDRILANLIENLSFGESMVTSRRRMSLAWRRGVLAATYQSTKDHVLRSRYKLDDE
jgi:hypothetical protein